MVGTTHAWADWAQAAFEPRAAELVGAEHAGASDVLRFLHVVSAAGAFSLSGTHVMIHTSVNSWDHKVTGPSRNTQHLVHPWQIFSILDITQKEKKGKSSENV